VYRTREEVDQEKLRDPIALFRERALGAGWLGEADVRAIVKDVSDRIDDAVAFAEASPEPPADWLFTDIYRD
jgi:pyruvate dehydrogenase E1 component alpha subunit